MFETGMNGVRHRAGRLAIQAALATLVLGACAPKAPPANSTDAASSAAASKSQASAGKPVLSGREIAGHLAFAYTDDNADGRISFEEYRNRAMHVFVRSDSDGDGTLQVAEHVNLAGATADPSAVSTDVTVADFNAALANLFQRVDSNADGFLSPDEWHDVTTPAK